MHAVFMGMITASHNGGGGDAFLDETAHEPLTGTSHNTGMIETANVAWRMQSFEVCPIGVCITLSGKFPYAPYNYLTNGAGSEQTL